MSMAVKYIEKQNILSIDGENVERAFALNSCE